MIDQRGFGSTEQSFGNKVNLHENRLTRSARNVQLRTGLAILRSQPEHVRSPTHVQLTQRGNSFELATYLACLLLGLGCNAYVASGYASREQSLCDQTRRTCPYLEAADEAKAAAPQPTDCKYRPKSPPNFESRFLAALDEKISRERQRERQDYEEMRRRMITEAERPAADPYFGRRVHAWIVLLPGGQAPAGSEIVEPLFVEPSTGTFCPSSSFESHNAYLGLESLWNDRNYWVNVQDCTEACAKLKWDLRDLQCWEHLLAGEPKETIDVKADDDDDDGGGDGGEDGGDDDEHAAQTKIRRYFHMVMPASYVEPLQLSHEAYERRYPGGQKVVHYKKTKVQLHAPYARQDGLVRSVVAYDDYDYKTPLRVYEKFENRCDCLERSEKDLSRETATEYFAAGRPDACQAHRYCTHGRDAVDDERTLEFYKRKRLDELVRIEMGRAFASLDYGNRDDGLVNRFVEYSTPNENNPEEDVHYRTITKITDKFRRNELVDAKMDVALREFDFVEHEIRLTYHYSDDEYTQAIKRFAKPARAERSNKNPTLPEMLQNYQPDPMGPAEELDKLTDELEMHLNEEDASITDARHAESVVHEFLQLRLDERLKSALQISRFDPIRNQENKEKILLEEEKRKEQSKKEIEAEIDLLSPYISQLGNVKYLTKKQALQVRSNCLDDFKESSIMKAERIMREFEKCNRELENMQSMMIDSENVKKDQKEQILKDVKEMEAKLRSLDLYLNRHKELVQSRYRKLVKVLQQDQQLAILYNE
ncbi:dynein regulatory complex subunit 7 [Phymastichus coffea]|uniref:dynein regulatory complex subunit 7 n=1 Tax=Phymastichus coffea TaxID=108790 RepID=UPI00273C2231|nr:dynein regulatory complex subunit 7 [Phymastichus coffea]